MLCARVVERGLEKKRVMERIVRDEGQRYPKIRSIGKREIVTEVFFNVISMRMPWFSGVKSDAVRMVFPMYWHGGR